MDFLSEIVNLYSNFGMNLNRKFFNHEKEHLDFDLLLNNRRSVFNACSQL